VLALLLAALLLPGSEPLPAGTIRCTPTSVRFADGTQLETKDAIPVALSKAKPGDRIEVEPGDYPAFGIGHSAGKSWNAITSGGTPDRPIVVEGRGTVRILGVEDTIHISQRNPNGWITFKNLVIVPGYRAGILFAMGGVHRGHKFHDCDILGTWNHLTDSGDSSKWGVWGRGMADFEFKGVTRRARIQDLRREHAFYIENPAGDMTLENIEGRRLGRTFVQFTARESTGEASTGRLTVRNCLAEDVCIGAGDGHKGGSAFTVAGRLTGEILFERNVYRAGFDPALRRLTRPGSPYGTGAFVAWMGAERVPNGHLILRDNDFEIAPGCGDRSLVMIGGCEVVDIVGKNRFIAGGKAALDIEPPKKEWPDGEPVGELSVDPQTVLKGEIRRRGKAVKLDALTGG
jgi:hypothetical protein